MNRRAFIRLFSALVAMGAINPAFALAPAEGYVTGHSDISNFKSVYKNPGLRNSFLSFLQHVYSIYPPDKFHKLIGEVTAANETDAQIYAALQKRLPEVKSFLGPVTRSLPSLSHQKDEMSGQVGELLKDTKTANGYMEIGTTGRYVHAVQDKVKIKGNVYLLNTARPQFFSFTDIAERGQLSRIGKFVDMGNYKTIAPVDVPHESLDLVTNFIGFHHSPPEVRADFIASVVSKLRPGGRLILRDHDVDSDDMRYIVALAHDVFNAGLDVSWDTDLHEIRNFTSVPQIEDALHKAGMKRVGDKLLQPGDPTRNTMMLFVKTA